MPRKYLKRLREIRKDFHPTLNCKLKFSDIPPTSRKYVWWKCYRGSCGHNWKDTFSGRVAHGRNCPRCTKLYDTKRVKDIFHLFGFFEQYEKDMQEIIPDLEKLLEDKRSINRKSGVKARSKMRKLKKLGVEINQNITKQLEVLKEILNGKPR